MFLLFLFIGVLFLMNINKAAQRTKECVGKHTWITSPDPSSEKGYLICKVCGKIPG